MRIIVFLYCGEIVDVSVNYILSTERMNVFMLYRQRFTL